MHRMKLTVGAWVLASGLAGPALAQETRTVLTPPTLAQNPTLPGKVKPDPAAVGALASSIRAAITRQPASASRDDHEAAIAFAVDQSGQAAPVALAAIDQVDARKLRPIVHAALDAVRRAIKRRALNGTGGITGGGPAGLGAGPAVGGGGGGSDYTPPS